MSRSVRSHSRLCPFNALSPLRVYGEESQETLEIKGLLENIINNVPNSHNQVAVEFSTKCMVLGKLCFVCISCILPNDPIFLILASPK